MLHLTLLLLSEARELDALFLGAAGGALFFTCAALGFFCFGLGGQPRLTLFSSELGLGLLAVRLLGDGERARHLDIDVCLSKLDQIISEGVDEAVEDPLNV